MAPDEALLELRREGRSPDTLRLYVFKLSAVTIGYFQMEMGVEVALFAFTPIGGTPMERRPRPGLERYRAVQLIGYRLSRGRDPGILGSRGGEGRTREGPWLESALEAILTSGCPGCNRPFYNETPRVLYNYPSRELLERDREELEKAIRRIIR